MKGLKSILVLSLGLFFGQLLYGQVDSTYLESVEEEIANTELTLINVKDNFYLISSEMGGNILAFVGSEGLTLVDNQWAVLVLRIKELLTSISHLPVCRVIDTHYHFDHTDGNKVFRRDGVPVFAHQNTLNRLSTDQVISPPFHILQKAYSRESLPTITFKHSMTIYDSQEEIELIHVPNAHTDGDVVVHFKKADVYHTGDIFVTYGLPFIDENNGGDIYAMIEAIEHLISVSGPETMFIPGHGPLCTLEDVKEYRDLLVNVREQVLTCISEGLNMEETLPRVKVDPGDEGISMDHSIKHMYRMAQKHK